MTIKRLDSYLVSERFPFLIKRTVHHLDDMPDLHGHDFVELVFVIRGVATHRFQNIEYEIRAGDVFMINPGEEHGYALQENQEVEIMNCLFHPGLIHETLLHELQISHSLDFLYVQPFLNEEIRFYHRLNLRGEASGKVLYLLQEMQQELDERRPGYEAFIRLQMIQLIILLSRYLGEAQKGIIPQVNKNELLVRRVCGYLERHYNQKITHSTLSKLFHLSPRQLNRQFNQYVGRSVIEYVQHIRIEKAKHLLTETDDIIAVVAETVGYEDAAYFSTLFTRIVGCSPGKYRETSE